MRIVIASISLILVLGIFGWVVKTQSASPFDFGLRARPAPKDAVPAR